MNFCIKILVLRFIKVLMIDFVVFCVFVNIILIFCVFLSNLIIIGVLLIVLIILLILLGWCVKFVFGIFMFLCDKSCNECNLFREWLIVIDLLRLYVFIILNW